MKPVFLVGLTSLSLLAACEQATVFEDDRPEESFGMFAITDASREGASSAPAPAPHPLQDTAARARDDGAESASDEGSERLVAYSYGYQLETPAAATSTLVETHRDACVSAGPETCQVVNANIRQQGDRGVSATLSLRAVPAWIDEFRSGLSSQLDTADGRIRNQTQTAEDLTATIVDLEARLTAKEILRTRLTALLERPGASVEELVRVERELARLQGDIEGSQARIRALRGRVSMSAMTLNYASRIEPVSRSAFDPLGRALRNLSGDFARGLADVLGFIAGFLPWLIVILPVGWLGTRWGSRLLQRRREQRKA